MAGHSKFKNIMHRKGAQDRARAKLFTRLGKEISGALLQQGCEIIIASRNMENLNSTKNEITGIYGGIVHTVSFNICFCHSSRVGEKT